MDNLTSFPVTLPLARATHRTIATLVSLPGFVAVQAERLYGADHTIITLIERERPGPWQIVDVRGDGNCFYYAISIAYFLATGRMMG